MKHLWWFATLLLASCQAAPTLDSDETSIAGNSQRYFVELTGAPLSDGGDLAALAAERAAFRSEAAQAGVQFVERYEYADLFNGFSIEVATGDVGKLQQFSGVKRVHPVSMVEMPTPEVASEPDLQNAVNMTGASIARNELGLTGEGIRVAILDTGIAFDHPDLGGCFGEGCRVERGYDLVGDAYDFALNPHPVPDPIPNDCAGHGTHVAGIVGASGRVVGVAPAVKLSAYRVFGCTGATGDDILLAAMERVSADGADVLNMSIGAAFRSWASSPTAAASDRLVRKGIVVVASAGNSGALGTFSTGAPSTGTKTISVASYDNLRIKLPGFTLSPDGEPIGYLPGAFAPAAPKTGTAAIAVVGTPTSDDAACAALPAASLAGKVALIRRGTCTFYQKAVIAQNAGATGVIFYNATHHMLSPFVFGTPRIRVPVVGISGGDGARIYDRAVASGVSITWTAELHSVPNPTAGLVSSFSSFGPTAELDFKPDLGAPGGSIESTYPLERGGYATLSGTSMAAPHVAGAVALLLQARPHTPPALVRDLLQNSASPAVYANDPASGMIDSVHRQGAGMLDIVRAVTSDTIVQPAKLALGESHAGPATRTLTFANDSAESQTYELTHTPALTTTGTVFVPQHVNIAAQVTFSSTSIEVPAGGEVSVDVTIAAPAAAAHSVYGGYIVASREDGARVRVPYMGLVGDYQTVSVLQHATFPRLGRALGSNMFRLEGEGATYSLQGADVPHFLVHLGYPVRRARVDIFAAPTSAGGPLGRAWHRGLDLEHVPRNAVANQFFPLAFGGTTTSGNKTYALPNGRYVAVLQVLKPLGDDNNPAHWETWQSPTFVIARP